MSQIAKERSKTAWLLTFGDVVTLLISFFILAIVINKTKISPIQKWTQSQIDLSYQHLLKEGMAFDYLQVQRNSMGIEVVISDSTGFKKGGYEPSINLADELQKLAYGLRPLPLFQVRYENMPNFVQQAVKQHDLHWRVEVIVAGHTDNDKIDPRSSLKNNWFLSTMRAQSIMKILEEHTDFNRNMYSVAGYGEFRPIVANNSLKNKAKNRRIHMVISATLEKKPMQMPTLNMMASNP